MDENLINTNTDEIITRWERAYERVEEIMRTGNEELVRGMEQTAQSLGSIYERLIDKYRMESENLLRITEQVYKTLSDIDDRFTKDKVDKLDTQIEAFKKMLDDEIGASREGTQQKMDLAAKELEDIKQKSHERTEIIKREVEEIKKEYKGLWSEEAAHKVGKGAHQVSSGVETALGGQSGELGEVLGMGADVVGGIAQLGSVNYGEGVRTLSNVIAKMVGMYVQLSIKEAAESRALLDVTASGTGGPAGDEIMHSVHELGVAFAGQAEFEFGRVTRNLQTMAASRQFEGMNQGQQLDFYTQNTLMGMGQGVNPEEMISITSELKEKLKIPIDEVSGVFSQLTLISKDLQRPLKEIINDFTSLHHDTQRYGYTREQEMGMIVRFNDEIKTGILSISDLSQYMQGLSGQSQEGATGVAAMLKDKSIRGSLLQQVKDTGGNAEDAADILGMLDQMDELTGGATLRLLNNPKAKGPVIDALKKQIKSSTGMGSEDLERLNPQVEKLLYAFTDQFSGEGGESLGEKQLLYEKMGSMVGLPMDNNLTKQGEQREGYLAVGVEDGVKSFKTALDEVTKQTKDYTTILERDAISGVKMFVEGFELLLKENKKVMDDYMRGTIDLKQAGERLKDNFEHLSHTFQKAAGIDHKEEEKEKEKSFLENASKNLFNWTKDNINPLTPFAHIEGAVNNVKEVFSSDKKEESSSVGNKEFTLKIASDDKEFAKYNEATIKRMIDNKMLDPSMLEIFKQILTKNR